MKKLVYIALVVLALGTVLSMSSCSDKLCAAYGNSSKRR